MTNYDDDDGSDVSVDDNDDEYTRAAWYGGVNLRNITVGRY